MYAVIFTPIGGNTELKDKYSKLFDLIKRMNSIIINDRPNCETILNERNEWALSLCELKTKIDVESNAMKSNDDLFHKRFIKVMLNKYPKIPSKTPALSMLKCLLI